MSTEHPALRRVAAWLLAALPLLPTPALAWGSIGHRIVGQVADRGLSPRAALRVGKIMGTASLGSVANWMDQVRGTPIGIAMEHWHYESVSVCDPASIACSHEDCAAPQIEAAAARLRSGQGNQLNALRVLVHLVGDIHQPLHSAENGDRGGNKVIVENRQCIDLDGKVSACQLHTYWDNNLVKRAMNGRTEKAFVDELASRPVETEGDAAAWMMEANALAKASAHHYDGFACKIGPNRIRLTTDYDKAASADVAEQLARAGRRLAHLLNEIYKP